MPFLLPVSVRRSQVHLYAALQEMLDKTVRQMAILFPSVYTVLPKLSHNEIFRYVHTIQDFRYPCEASIVPLLELSGVFVRVPSRCKVLLQCP
jgi:hypothetical protein